MAKPYPKTFSILTPDGEGEATKEAQGEAWEVNIPTGGLSHFGSVTEVKEEILKRLHRDYPEVELFKPFTGPVKTS